MAAENPLNSFPENRAARVQWVKQRGPRFVAHAEEVGVPASTAAAMVAAAAEAEAAEEAYERSRSRTRDLGGVAREASAKMSRLTQAAIANVRARANTSSDPAGVCGLVSVQPVQPPSPRRPPEPPTAVTPSLRACGEVRIDWAGKTSQRSFQVQRLLRDADGRPGAWEDLPGQFARPATDPGLPVGTTSVQYRVQAFRHGRPSGWSGTASLHLVASAAPGPAAPLRVAA